MRYKCVSIDGRNKYLHRVLWEAAHGPIPEGHYIDHINGDRLDNRLANLRLVNPSQSAMNLRRRGGKKNDLPKGVSKARRGAIDYFRVQVQAGPAKVERYFRTLEEAISCAQEARNLLHGEYARHD